MGLFDGFSAEGLIRAMGIDPGQLIQEYHDFRVGMNATILHFNAKLNAIEAQNAEILAMLRADRESPAIPAASSAAATITHNERTAEHV